MSPGQPSPTADGEYDVPWWREKTFVNRMVISTALVCLLGGLAWFVGYPAFQDFRKKRIVRIAREFVQTEDYRSAYLLLDQHVKKYPDNLEARRLLAKVLEDYGAGQGLVEWEFLTKIEPGNAANQIGYITAALRVGQLQHLPAALANLQKIQPDGIEFHRLSAGLALLKGNAVALRRSVEAMALIEPDKAITQFHLATLRLNSSVPGEVASAREVLEKLAHDDSFRIRAVLALISDAPKRWPKEKTPAKQYALILRQLDLGKTPLDSPSGFMKTGAVRIREPGLPTLLEYLQNQPSPSPEDIAQLAQWMIKIGQTRDALVWLETLPEVSRNSPAALAEMAACAVALESWDKLEQLLVQGAWGPVSTEIVRQAFQARLLREQKNDSRAESVWNGVLQVSGQSLPGLRLLHRLAQSWRWPGKEAQVLWVIVRQYPQDNLAWEKLANQVMAARDTAQVWRFYNVWVQTAPDNIRAQAERVVVGLLIRPQEAGLTALSEKLYRSDPNHPACRLAQALALWRGGLSNEALIVLDAVQLNPASEPRVALARGLVLAAIGRRSESERMFALVKSEWLLPEENALIAAARAR